MQEVALSAVAALALFLAGATVSAELFATALGGDEPLGAAAADTGEVPVRAYLEAVLQRNDLGAGNGTGEERCVTLRTIKTTYRPVLLINRTESGCAASEILTAELTIESPAPVEIVASILSLCPTTDYTMTARAGDRLTAAAASWCYGHDVRALPTLTPASRRHSGFVVFSDQDFAATGLYVLCAASLVELPDGSRRIVQDLTWFEVWAPADGAPGRPGHLQSTTPDASCTDLGLPFKPKPVTVRG